MPSPFPGMDPFLEEEKLWPAFHQHLVQSLYQMLLPGLMDRYRARVLHREYVLEQALFTSVVREPRQEPFIEIRQRTDGKLVTILDVVSPTNRTSSKGRDEFLGRRLESRRMAASSVEIDLVLQGTSLHDYSREGLPDWDYAVTVVRSSRPEQYEIYTATLQKRLPRFRLPLSSDDRDTVVDLQAAFQRAFDQGDFVTQIAYDKDPTTTLSDTQRRYLDEKLRDGKLR